MNRLVLIMCFIVLSFCTIKLAAVEEYFLDRRYNDVTFLMTHNSTSLRSESTFLGDAMRKIASFLPNEFPFSGLRDKVYAAIKTITLQDPNIVADQERDISAQLRDGVRAFKLPLHFADTDNPAKSDIFVCHTLMVRQIDELIKEAENKLSFIPIKKIREALLKPLYEFRDNPCQIDSTRVSLVQVFSLLNQWLEKNPQEVIGIYLDVGLAEKELAKATMQLILKNSGLDSKKYVYTQGPWPTLRTMIKTNKRVIVMADCESWRDLGFAFTKDIAFGSNYSYKEPEAVYADTNNPQIAYGQIGVNQLFIVDNYTTPLISGRVVHAQQINRYEPLVKRVLNYEKLANRPVNYVMVDFYNEPNNDAIKVVADINRRMKF